MIVPVELGEQSYDIVIEKGALGLAGRELRLDRKVLIVTDSGVPAEYAKAVAEQCGEAHIIRVPMGEGSKCFEQFENLLAAMLDFSFTRKDCVVAVGGGVVGDLGGFAASCYMRGIDFYNIPTTLLSQVDSSVGGKTAIDFRGMKNIVGTFYQPKKVIVDPNVLSTLDERQLHAGLAEAIKMSVTFDGDLFSLIENSSDLFSDLPEIIGCSLVIKKNVVEKDPKEGGLRRALNFGHTVGHAIEALHGGELLHGECVALGMLPFCGKEVRARLVPVLEKYDLPHKIADKPDELMPFILHDKKMQTNTITAVFSDSLGTFRLLDIPPADISKLLEAI